MKTAIAFGVFLFFCCPQLVWPQDSRIDFLDRTMPELDGAARIQGLLELGELIVQSEPRRSRLLAEEALQLSESREDYRTVAQALLILGLASDALSRYEDSVRFYQRGIEIAESHEATPQLVRLLLRLGGMYALTGRSEEGLELSMRALSIAESSGDELGRSQVLGEIGVIYMLREEWAEAREWMTRALEAKRREADPTAVAGALSNLGVINRKGGHLEEALAHQLEALEIQQDLGVTRSIAASNSRIARIHTALGDMDAALEYHDKSLALREKIGDRRGVLSSLRDLRELHRSLGNLGTALDLYDRYVELRSEVFDEESRERIDELQTRFQVEQTERENEFLRQTNRQQAIGFILIFALAVLAGYSLLLRFRHKAAAATLESLRQRLRNAVLEMREPGDWPRVLDSLKDGFEHFLAGVKECRVLRVVQGAHARDQLYEICDGGDEQQITPFPGFLRSVIDSRQLSVLTMSDQEDTRWLPRSIEAAGSVVVIPVPRSVILLPVDRSLALSSKKRREILEWAKLVPGAIQRLSDLKALAVREAQLRQARRLELIGSLTAGIAHHFNNLLQVIIGSLEMVQLSHKSDLSTQLKDASNAANRASVLVDRLLIFSRRTSPVSDEKVDLVRLVRDLAEESDLEVEVVASSPDNLHVRGDESLLCEIVAQLISNASDAVLGQPDPRISILLEEVDSTSPSVKDAFVLVRVSDNGRGIPQEIRGQVFDPFFTTRRADREGLGLSIVTNHVQRHGGWVEISSADGEGTSVDVFLPRAQDWLSWSAHRD